MGYRIGDEAEGRIKAESRRKSQLMLRNWKGEAEPPQQSERVHVKLVGKIHHNPHQRKSVRSEKIYY
jgi:hypothetical protein